MSNIDKIARRVKALLAQAADQDGTPEGAAFRDMAFDLIAKYGVDETTLQGEDSNAMLQRTLDLTGAYSPMQLTLFTAIGKALRCAVVGEGTGQKVRAVHVFGRAKNVERVLLLFTILNVQMAAGASKQKAASQWDSTTVKRRSYMLGFARTIGNRLDEIENSAVEEAGQALVVRNEFREALLASRQGLGDVRDLRSSNRVDAHAARAGREDAARMDLQQPRMGARAALPM